MTGGKERKKRKIIKELRRNIMEEKKRILTGDRPTGRLHLGHYAGSLENRVRLQNEYEQFVIIADVQALTTHFEKPQILQHNVRDLCIDYIASGINPEKSNIFIQSMVPQIAELTVFFSMFVMVNMLRHNPTIKTEANQYGYKDLSYGFLGYPVSQAADILFCQADLVPVGEDQIPVIEITRKIVRRFNNLYKPVLKEPGTMMGNCSRLMGLDGSAKMGKSLNNAVYLSDSSKIISEKVSRALTDSGRVKLNDKGNPDNCVVSEYHRVFNGSEYQSIREMCQSANIGCTACKKNLTAKLDMMLAPIRSKRAELEKRPAYIDDILQEGTKKAVEEGRKTLDMVKEIMEIKYF